MTRAMKDSGIEWIGEIPEDWSISKYKYYSDNRMGETILVEDTNTEEGVPIYSATQDDKILGYVKNPSLVLHKGDFVIPARGNSIGCVSVVKEDVATCTQTTICSRNIKNINKDFLFYCSLGLHSEWFKYEGSAIPQVTVNQIKNNLVPIPSMPEQQKIADFLDEKCSYIDSVLEKVRASIDEYKQLKQSVITQAVTKGVRPNRPMKDSGIEWIGEIPQDWKVIKGKNVLELLSKPVKETDTVITCFRDGEVTLRSKRREDGFTISLQEIGYQGIDIGDLVVHGMDGFAGAIGISDSRGKGTPVLSVLDSKQNKKYLMYYLRAMAFNGVFIALATGIRVRSCDTSWNKLKNLPYPIPTEDEQVEIVAYLDDKCSKIDKLITKKEQLITELETYKKSLIYEYVTGKKEVK
nr:restriction endonuclease subunit S [uncultured Campylobacter sp.]